MIFLAGVATGVLLTVAGLIIFDKLAPDYFDDIDNDHPDARAPLS